MNDLGFIAFPAIVVLCYLVGATFKAINNDTLNKFIPIICGFVGGALGVIVYKTIPGYIPAENWLMALAIGIVSGFASTGINQVYQQFTKEEYVEKETDEDLPLEDEEEKTDSEES